MSSLTDVLISLRGGMDMEVVKGVALDLVSVFMAFAVVTPQSEESIGLWDSDG